MVTDHVKHPVYIGLHVLTYVLEYAVFRKDAAVLQDTTLVQHMRSITRILNYIFLHGLLYQFQCTILCIIVLYRAKCRCNNLCGCGNMEQNDSKTWRLFLRSCSIHVTSAHDFSWPSTLTPQMGEWGFSVGQALERNLMSKGSNVFIESTRIAISKYS